VRLSCDACGEVGPLEVRLSEKAPEAAAGGTLEVTCARCGAVAPVPIVASGAAPGDPAERDGDPQRSGPRSVDRRCPKCDALVGGRDACPGCGLSSTRMAGFSALREAEERAAVPDAVRAAWDAVTESPEAWATQARHDGFVQLVAAATAFAWAAGQYQEVRRRRPDDAIAIRQLERVRRTAEASMLASTTVREVKQPPYRGATAILVMLVVVLVAGALYAAFMREAHSPASTITPVAPLHPGARR
jgi:hypothetical protein